MHVLVVGLYVIVSQIKVYDAMHPLTRNDTGQVLTMIVLCCWQYHTH